MALCVLAARSHEELTDCTRMSPEDLDRGCRPRYYSVVFTVQSWTLFKAAGGSTAGTRESTWTRVQKINIGDFLLCYLVDVKRWVAILRVAGEPYWATEPKIWGDEPFPARIPVTIESEVMPTAGVSARDLVEHLPRQKAANDRHPGAWGNFVRGSPRQLPEDEARIVIEAVNMTARPRGLPPDSPPTKGRAVL